MDRRDKSRFCDFHNEVGHKTSECKHLAWELESLARDGYLDDFLKTKADRAKVARTEEVRRSRDGSRRPSRDRNSDIIYVIHVETEDYGLTSSDRKRKLRELYHLSERSKVIDSQKEEVVISFSDNDRLGVKYPHEDPLVVTVKVAGFNVRRVLVDNGSSVNILFYQAFQKMKFRVSELLLAGSGLSGFSGKTSIPLGRIKLPVQVGQETSQKIVLTTFFVVKTDSPYNAILGRTWLHDMKALASSYHQCLKYPVGSEVGVLAGNHIVARECLTVALSIKR